MNTQQTDLNSKSKCVLSHIESNSFLEIQFISGVVIISTHPLLSQQFLCQYKGLWC